MKNLVVLMLAVLLIAPSAIDAEPAGTPLIVGAWTLNKALSDAPREQSRGEPSGRRGGGGGGRGRSGGYSGGGGGGGFGRGAASSGDPEEARRRAEAVREIVEAPARLTITETDSLVIIVDGDGRTSRLSPDGKKIKDDSTGIEYKTKWEGDKLVAEITGAGRGKITETYSLDPDGHQLSITLQMENSQAQGGAGGVIHHVYDRLQDR